MFYETKFLISLGVTSVIEVPLAFLLVKLLYLRRRKLCPGGWGIVFVSLVASALTLPYFWFILSNYVDAYYYPYVGEGVVFLVEALLFWVLLRIGLWRALVVSLLANAASYFIGPLLFRWVLGLV